jgi:hypothetical protein
VTVSQVHEALGSFTLKLKRNIPREVLDAVEYFGHIAIIPGRADARTYGDGTLDSARYVGVVRKKKIGDDGQVSEEQVPATIGGVGMNFWLGDEEDKGSVIEEEVALNAVNFSTAISAVMPTSVQAGTIGGVSGSYTGNHQWQTPRKAIQYICDTMSQPATAPNLLTDNNSSFETSVAGYGTTNCTIETTGAYSYIGSKSMWITPTSTGPISAYTQPNTNKADTFNRSDSTTLGTSSSGHTWVNLVAGMGVQSNRAYRVSGAPVATIECGQSDGTVTGKFTTVAASSGLVFRSTGSGYNTLYFRINSAGTEYQIQYFDGATTVLASGGAVTPTNGDNLKVVLSGANIKAYVNDVLLYDVNSSLYQTNTKHGIHFSTAGSPTMDDWAFVDSSSTNSPAVVPGTTYNLSYWILPTATGTSARIGVNYKTPGHVTVSSATATSYTTLPANAWTQVARSITVPTGLGITNLELTVDLNCNATTNRFAVDYIEVRASTPDVPVSFRVNNDGTLDAGPESTLFVTTPTTIIVRRDTSAGEDLRLRAIPSSISLDQDMEDFATRVVVLAGSDGSQFTVGSADIGNVAPESNIYKDLFGQPLKLTKMVSESETTDLNADARAEINLRKTLNPHREININSQEYDIYGSFDVGDYIYIYDPDAGLVDTANEVYFRGVRLNPLKLQVTETEWPLTDDYSVGYRTADGTWYDLTDYVEFEEDTTTKITIGDFQRTLDDGLQDVQTRLGTNIAPDTSTPDAPTWVTGSFETVTYLDGRGLAKASQKVVWNEPLNQDASSIADGAYYEIQFRLNTGHLYSQTR